MNIKMEVVGYKDLAKNLQDIGQIVGGMELADSLDTGAQEIVWEAQLNVMKQGLYDTMALYNSIRTVKINQYRVDILAGSDDVPYAAVHEYGGTFTITERQRGFFWARFIATGDEMWKALALSKTYTIPMRAYMRPAVDTHKDAAVLTVAQSLGGKFAHVVKK